jgi:hypothetical protein
MRTLLIALGLLTVTTAQAQTTQYFDERGMPAGRAERFGNQTNYYDNRGMPAGRSQNFGGQTQYFDERGMPTGHSQNNGW